MLCAINGKMNAEDYKLLISQKSVLDHTTLNITLKEMASRQEFEVAREIKRVLENNKISKPDLHENPYDTTNTYYNVDLSSDDIEKITDSFFDLEAKNIGKNGETTPITSFYATLVDKWNLLL